MNHLEGTLERDGENLVAVQGQARFGIGRVVRDAKPGERVRIGLRPEEVHANSRGEGVPATCQTAMVMGHHLQIVATLETGEEVVARQRRAGDEGLRRPRRRRQAVAGLEPDRHAAPRARRTASERRHAAEPARSPGLKHERNDTRMPDRPDEINILVPEHRRAAIQRMITRRQAMLAGGGAHGRRLPGRLRRLERRRRRRRRRRRWRRRGDRGRAADPGRRPGRVRRAADGELGRLLRPGELQGLREGVRPRRSTSRASAPTTRSWPSCAPAARSTTSSRRRATR